MWNALKKIISRKDDALSMPRREQSNSGDAESYVSLGDAFAQQGQFAEAAGQYQNAIWLQPDNAKLHFALARVFAAVGRLDEAVARYQEAVRLDPEYAAAYCNLGLVLQQQGYSSEAEAALRRAVELVPGNGDFLANLRVSCGNRVPMWHFSMMNDAPRNATYEEAIVKAIRLGDRVFEIGTGSGLLAMMAARAGARHVTTCEMVEPVAMKARQIINKNGYGDKVTVIGKVSSALRIPEDMPERADIMIAEIVSSELIGEGILNSFKDAKERLLKPGAKIIPSAASIIGQLAGSDVLDRYIKVGSVAGFDLAEFNEFMPISFYPAEFDVKLEYYSAPFDIFGFDFQAPQHAPAERKHFSINVSKNGRCYGVLQWIRLQLSDTVHFENAPDNPECAERMGHWRQILYTFPSPVMLRAGQVVHLVAAHNRSNLVFHVDGIE